MRHVRLRISYDGTDFYGWQYQTGVRTVQQTVELTVLAVTGEKVNVVSSGRTDAGVHALGQVISFTTTSALDNETLMRALNASFPDDIVALEIDDVPLDFDPIMDAKWKRYRYLIKDGMPLNPLLRSLVWHVRRKLDEDRMRRAAQTLLGTHDFSSFENSGSRRQTKVRTIREISITREQIDNLFYGSLLVVEIEANGFLYNMARNIVGTLVDVGKHNNDWTWPEAAMRQRDRRTAGMTAPPYGLYLLSVTYDE